MFERDELSVVRDRRPEHAAAAKCRELFWRRRRTDGFDPNVLGAAAIGNEVERLPVGRPHWPQLFRTAICDRFIFRWSAVAHKPDFGFVEMAVAVAPPLTGSC